MAAGSLVDLERLFGGSYIWKIRDNDRVASAQILENPSGCFLRAGTFENVVQRALILYSWSYIRMGAGELCPKYSSLTIEGRINQ